MVHVKHEQPVVLGKLIHEGVSRVTVGMYNLRMVPSDRWGGSAYVGRVGEDIAARFLEERGFVIIDRNFRKTFGEIDLVALRNGVVHFVEVKTVTRETFHEGGDVSRPEDNIDAGKLRRVGITAEVYLNERKIENDWKISVIAVILHQHTKEAKVRWIEDV